jgi:uncharacterized protein YoxC
MSFSQLVVASLGAIIATIYLIATSKKTSNPIALDKKWPAFSRFAREVATVDDQAVPTLLLQRVDKLNADINLARSTLDAKASTMLGFLGGGVSVLAILARGSGTIPPTTAGLVAGAAALFAALIYSLAVLWAKPRQEQFGLDNYCDVPFLKDPTNLGRLAALACHSGIEQTVGVFQDALDKGRMLRNAQFFFVLGAALLVLNSFVK